MYVFTSNRSFGGTQISVTIEMLHMSVITFQGLRLIALRTSTAARMSRARLGVQRVALKVYTVLTCQQYYALSKIVCVPFGCQLVKFCLSTLDMYG